MIITIYNSLSAANQNIEDDLHTSPAKISWSLSAYILIQCNLPLLWSAISEIKGRKVLICLCLRMTDFELFLLGGLLGVVRDNCGRISRCGYV